MLQNVKGLFQINSMYRTMRIIKCDFACEKWLFQTL